MKINQRGITLIALVVTIVVLLILAGVSISMLTGENGIINQASNAKDATEQARVEELVDLAINSLIGENLGSTNGITPQMIAEEVNEMENRSDIYAEGNEFPTKIIFPEEGREVEVNLDSSTSVNEIYSEPGAEEQIAPTDLFNFEIIDSSAKTAKILGIKSQYCNVGGFNTETQKEDLPDTNYRINYSGITDTLVIPYQTEIDGEIYTITEVDLSIEQIDEFGEEICKYSNLPDIETIIYPNTVTKVYSASDIRSSYATSMNSILKKIVLSENLKEIPRCFLAYAKNLKEVTIPKSVIYMSREVFRDWDYTQTINVPFKEGETPSGWDEYWNDWCDATINYLK